MVVSFFPIFYFSNHFNFYFDAKILLVNSTSLLLTAIFKKYKETSRTKWITITIVTSKSGIYIATCKEDSLSSQGQGDGWILGTAYFLENYIGTNDWLLLIKHYNLWKVLARSTTFFQLSLFCATFFQLCSFVLFISSKTSSSQCVLGLLIGLLDMGFHLLISFFFNNNNVYWLQVGRHPVAVVI